MLLFVQRRYILGFYLFRYPFIFFREQSFYNFKPDRDFVIYFYSLADYF